MEILDDDGQVESVAVEGKGTDVEDLTITFADGSEEAVQVIDDFYSKYLLSPNF